MQVFLFALCAFSATYAVVVNDAKPVDAASFYNASEHAYDLFTIVLSGSEGERETADAAETHVVFTKGSVNKAWVPPIEDKATEADKLRLFHHDEYADRISFEMFYGVSDVYEYNMPSVTSSDDKVAQPKILDYRSDVDEKSASFSVVYDCAKRPNISKPLIALVSVFVPVVSGAQVMYSMLKTCGGGVHPHAELGVYRAGRDERLGASRVRFDAARGYVAGAHVMSSRIYLHLHMLAGTQEFFHPIVATKSDILVLTTRGPTFGGVLRGGESAILHVMYECRGVGAARITISIPIPPFRPLRAAWTKDCGGGRANGLRVGSQNYTAHDVVDGGVPSERWILDVDALSGGTSLLTSRNLPTFNSSITYRDFYLTNDGDPLQIGTPVFTVDRPSTLSLFAARPPSQLVDLFLTGNDDILSTGTSRRLRLVFICKKAGAAHVLVTLPIKSFSTVEFGFRKQCNAPRRVRYSPFLRTANSFMSLSILIIIVLMVIWSRHQLDAKLEHRTSRPTTSAARLLETSAQ